MGWPRYLKIREALREKILNGGMTNELWAEFRAAPLVETSEQTDVHRWNIEETDTGIRLCRGEHERGEDCQWEEFVRLKPKRIGSLSESIQRIIDAYRLVQPPKAKP